MKFEPRSHRIKSGKDVVIRLPLVTEAKELIALKRSYIKNTNTIPMVLAEYSTDVESEAKLISDYHESQNSVLLIAEYDDELIGNIDLTGSKRIKMSHTAMLGMGIREEWRNQGLGRILIEEAIEYVAKFSSLELIWLDVYASNKLGYNLYKHTGFEVSGVIERFFKEGEEYMDKIQMFRHIKKE